MTAETEKRETKMAAEDYPKVLHQWELVGHHGRIVETEPGIVHSEEAMDDDARGRLWLSNRSPFGWQNEMLQLLAALAKSEERVKELEAAIAKAAKLFPPPGEGER